MSAKILASGSFEQALDETDESYNQTASAIVGKLRYTWPSHGYSAVVYYAYTGPLKSDFVFYNGSVEDSFGVSANGTKAFVKRYKNEDANRLTDQWKSVKLEPETLAKLFEADGPSTSMAERFRKTKLDAKLFGDGGFRAAAVVPCAYRFVWYELGWQYFHTYGTTSPYVLTYRSKNAYKPCGCVVLFP